MLAKSPNAFQQSTLLLQGRIQDFPLGGGGGRQPSLEGVPTSDTGTFW